MNLQNYVDAIASLAPCEFALSSAKTANNSIKVPDIDEELYVNFDAEAFVLDTAKLNSVLRSVSANAAAAALAWAETRRVGEKVDYYLEQFEKIGVKGLDKTDLLLILFDAASVRDFGFVSPQMQMLIDKLAPVPTPKK